jgi:hypothetical protein
VGIRSYSIQKVLLGIRSYPIQEVLFGYKVIPYSESLDVVGCDIENVFLLICMGPTLNNENVRILKPLPVKFCINTCVSKRENFL